MTEKAQHTPTPWRFGRTGDDQKMILGANAKYVCSVQIHQTPRRIGLHYEPERKANAAHIVRCVNLHDELIEALENAFLAMGRTGANHVLDHQCRGAWENARAVLAKAKETA